MFKKCGISRWIMSYHRVFFGKNLLNKCLSSLKSMGYKSRPYICLYFISERFIVNVLFVIDILIYVRFIRLSIWVSFQAGLLNNVELQGFTLFFCLSVRSDFSSYFAYRFLLQFVALHYCWDHELLAYRITLPCTGWVCC